MSGEGEARFAILRPRASRWWMVVVALVATGAAAMPGAAAESNLVVGLASVDITPSGPVRLNGFGGRTRESQGVRLPIRASAIAIGPAGSAGGSAAGTAVVIVVETLGIPRELAERLAARLAVRGVERSFLAVCATHTHGAPMIRDCANTIFGKPVDTAEWGRILAYGADLEAKLEEVAVRALDDRRPARVTRHSGSVGFAANRRTPGGPVDHSLPLLVVRSPEGELRGVFCTYACHCVTLSDDLVSGDWAGYAVQHLERRHPGSTAVVSIGCGADADPRGGVRGGDWQAADLLGRELADEVDRLLSTEGIAVTGAPQGAIERLTLPLATLPQRGEWERLALRDDAVGHHARCQLERIRRGEPLAESLDYPVQTITFGDGLAWVFLPGEVVVDYSLRLARELDRHRVWVHAYANGCPGYVPSERILREGGYEGGAAVVYYDIPAPWAPGLEDRIVASVTGRLGAVFAPAKGPADADVVPDASAAAAALRVGAGFRVELVAAEPLVESPVAVAFGADGGVWVAEMTDYPSGMPDGRPAGRVRRLHDDDRDGRPDRATTFLEGIQMPTGVTAWRDGVLVCAAPDILFARDTDGDGRADRIETLFSGFATHNAQARVNGVEYALEGWLEGSCGLFGGEITSAATGHRTALGSRDFRIDPDRGSIEPAAGSSQQGRVRDDAGEWFGCTNGELALHFPLPDAWLRRNPYVAPRRTAVSIASQPGPGNLFPLSQPRLFALSGPPGRPTAACGIGVYRDDLLGADGRPFTGDLFTCEPANNLVHHQRPVESGVSFAGERVASEGGREFLASTDASFRPVQARTAPDGSLWIVDMARAVIEHPTWIPEATLAALDVRAGADRGRIWRVVPEAPAAASPLRPVPRLDRLSGAELAAAMDTPNGTVRDLVQQSILWRQDRDAAATLESLATRSPRAAVRLQAMCTLDALGGKDERSLGRALLDPSPPVRRHAVRLATRDRLPDGGLAETLERLVADPDPGVRLRLAAGADALPDAAAGRVLRAIAAADGADEWFAAAIESACDERVAAAVVDALAAIPEGPPAALEGLLLACVRRVGRARLEPLIDRARTAVLARPAPESLARAARLLASIRRHDATAPAGDWRPAILVASRLLARAEGDPDDDSAAAAAALLGQARFLGYPSHAELVAALDARTSPRLRRAILAALREDGDPGIGRALADRSGTLPPDSRRDAVALLLERGEWAADLVAAIADGRLTPADLDLAERRTLLEHPDDGLRAKAEAVFGGRPAAVGGDTIRGFVAAAEAGGAADRGEEVFRRHCASCHRVADMGHDVGPDVAPYAVKPAAAFVEAVLDPHRAVDPRYQAHVVHLADGRSLTGTVVEETASSVVVLGADGRREPVLRREIDAFRSTGKSLMPEGFDRVLGPAGMADLWSWVVGLRAAPKAMAGNAPSPVAVDSAGRARLEAAAAEIRGGDIVFEPAHANVGMWHGSDDSVRWRTTSEAPRQVEVWAEWACDAGSAGNRIRIDGLEPSLVAEVASTGAWSRYVLVRLGRAELAAGAGEIVVRADGSLRGALVDLRAIHLVPPGESPDPIGDVAPANGPADGGLPPPEATPDRMARFLLDGARSDELRGRLVERLVAGPPAGVAETLRSMVAGLPLPSGSAEESARIPAIWRLAVAAGKGGDAETIRRVIAESVPVDGVLRQWQAVVLGGGIVNGVGLAGRWPGRVVGESLAADAALGARWERALEDAVRMAADPSVPDGTRYDALRMVALLPPGRSVPELSRVLASAVSEEILQGAVSGLADVEDPSAAAALLAALPRLGGANRDFAIRGLVRGERRALDLLAAVAAGMVPDDVRRHEAVAALRDDPSAAVRAEATAVLGPGDR